MEKITKQIEETLNQAAVTASLLEPGEESTLSTIAGQLSGIETGGNPAPFVQFTGILQGVNRYVQKVLDGKETDVSPVEDGIYLLRAINRAIAGGTKFGFQTDELEAVFNRETETGTPDSPDAEPAVTEEADALSLLDRAAVLAHALSTDSIIELGELLNLLEKLHALPELPDFEAFRSVSEALTAYIQRIVMGDEKNTAPIGDAVTLLRACVKAWNNRDTAFSFPVTDVLEILSPPSAPDPAREKEPDEIPAQAVCDLEDDELGILADFVLEAREGLEAIEINLIDLEQSPDDKEIINAIFRPFHTIKGVSGFLGLTKINRLSHSAENLLDSSRNSGIAFDNATTDMILESVDVLKQLIDAVDDGLAMGKSADDAAIDVLPLIRRIDSNPILAAEDKPLGEILVDRGHVKQEALTDALATKASHPEKKIGEILVENKSVPPREVISALRDQKVRRRTTMQQVKVDTVKLDNLVDLTGELVISHSILKQNVSLAQATDQRLSQNMNHLGQIVSNIQRISMSMRMVSIGATFQKMVRLVRDLSRSCGKEVSLETHGEETEIDRNVVETLYEPMVHMVRNSVDHGLESTEERIRNGKPAKGNISLTASQKGGNIVIEITDDGKGLNTLAILDKAINLGLVRDDEDLPDQEIFTLIMEPGFSTAKEVTDISGRGVGMDVVKKSIEGLNGRIDIRSEEGKGSTFSISLPLTLAIIEGMLVRTGEERLIIPTMSILESLRLSKESYYTLKNSGEMIMFRNNLIPLVRLHHLYGTEMGSQDLSEGIVVVVENQDELRAILVDELLGKEEFVIKNLGENLKSIKGLAGGAIMGDGRVGLIIDIGGLFEISKGQATPPLQQALAQ